MPYTLPVVKVRLKENWMDWLGSSRFFSRFPCTSASDRAKLRKLVFRTIVDPAAIKFSLLSSSATPMSIFVLAEADQPDTETRVLACNSTHTFGSTVSLPRGPTDPACVACYGWPLNPNVEPDQMNYERSDFVRGEMARSLWLDHPLPRPLRLRVHYYHVHCFELLSTRQPKYALVSESVINSTTTRFTYRSHARPASPHS